MYCNLLLNTHVVIITGWIAVQRDKWIYFNLEEYSLAIKTDSTLRSDDVMTVEFSTSQGKEAGALELFFDSTHQYAIWYCSELTNFPTNLPSDNNKVWRVTLTRTSGIRLVVHCNEEEVLNTLISDSTCGQSNWSNYWNKEVSKIIFSDNTAADYYKTQPGSCVF